MKVAKKEMLLIYNSGQIRDRETYAYAKSLQNHTLKEIDIKNNSLTATQLKQMSSRLNVEPEKLIDTKSPKYLQFYSDKDLSETNILKTLKQNPGMLKTPIAVYHDSADFISTPYEFVGKEL